MKEKIIKILRLVLAGLIGILLGRKLARILFGR